MAKKKTPKSLQTPKPEKRDFPKPCHTLGWCPYGWLVEFFPLRGKAVQWNGKNLDIKPLRKNKELSCSTFGHDCPVFYSGEKHSEDGGIPAITHKGENDYILNDSAWLERDNLAMHIRIRDGGQLMDGVIVDVMRNDDPDGEVLDSIEVENPD